MTKPDYLFSTDKLTKQTVSILNDFDQIIQGVRPLNSRQLQQLPENIRNLSHQLTDQRGERRLGYMNENVQLSSYVRYYTWWNLVRLTRLFSNLPAQSFPDTDAVCLDVGSGPLTVVTALWLARPELRSKKLTWYCLDVSQNSMSLGEDIYLSVAAKTQEEPWKIIRVKGSFGTFIKQKCDFITCANVLNEIDQGSTMPPEFQTKKYFEQFKTYGGENTRWLLIEPGVPKAARTLSLLRDRFIREGKTILAPCTHCGECPMNGFKSYTGSKNKWCNFAFGTQNAPAKLLKLSTQAKLPKERATLSFISVSSVKMEAVSHGPLSVRVISDGFRLPGGKTGCYGCSEKGLTLLSQVYAPDKTLPASGELVSVSIAPQPGHGPKKTPDLPIDEKSGAVIVKI